MGDDTMNEEYPDSGQRFAVCRTQWENRQRSGDMIREKIAIGHVEKAYEEKQVGEDGQEVPVGIVEGYLATWDTDRANDRFVRGAFADSVAELVQNKRPLRLKRQHFNLIGGFDPEKIQEDDKGLYGVAEINLLVTEGREAYALAKQGVLSDFSVGFSAEMEDVEMVEGVRVFKRVKLWETSLVDEPMNARARVTMVRSLEEQDESQEAIIKAVAEYRRDQRQIGEPEQAEIEEKLNALYRDRIGRPSPIERGVWSWSELVALPKSLRGYIIGHEKLSRDAVDTVVDLASPTTGKPSTGDEIKRLVRMLAGEKQTNEDVAAEVTGLLDAKSEAVDTMRDVIGREDAFNEDAMSEFMGLLEADTARNGTIADLLGAERAMDEDEEDVEKSIGSIIETIEGALR
jgi:HK97 family phage prohead protease